MRVLVLLLVLPLAVAQPELTDPEGDAPLGDLLEAWYEPTSATNTNVGMRFAELGDDALRIDATWNIVGPFGGNPEAGFGVTVWLTPSGDRAQQIRTDANNGPELALEVDRAAGTILVLDAWTGGRIWGGGELLDLEVVVHPAAPSDGIQSAFSLNAAALDEGGPGAARMMPLGGAGATSAWPMDGAARVTSPEDLDLPGPVDLTGIWIATNGTGFDLSAQMRSMTFEEAVACESLRVFVGVGGYEDGYNAHGLFSLDFADGWVSRDYRDFDAELNRNYDTIETLEFPYEVRWVFGTPGYFQIHAQDVQPASLDPRVSVHCGDLDTTLREEFTFGDVFSEGAPFILPIFFATLATILGTILVKNRQNRR